jgi:hypothetical protein
MGATVEHLEQLLNLLREVDLPTLLAFDRKLHWLLAQKEKKGGVHSKAPRSKRSFANDISTFCLTLISWPWLESIPKIPSRKTKPSSVKPSPGDRGVEAPG